MNTSANTSKHLVRIFFDRYSNPLFVSQQIPFNYLGINQRMRIAELMSKQYVRDGITTNDMHLVLMNVNPTINMDETNPDRRRPDSERLLPVNDWYPTFPKYVIDGKFRYKIEEDLYRISVCRDPVMRYHAIEAEKHKREAKT